MGRQREVDIYVRDTYTREGRKGGKKGGREEG